MSAVFDQLAREKLDTLDGSRPQGRGRAAVRIEDARPLMRIEQMQARKAAGGGPTQAEFDALVDDVARLNARLAEFSEILRKRLI